MTLALGVDTGGTYTDAVLIEDQKRVLASAKALTTRGDLAIGITAAVRSVLEQSGVDPSAIGISSLSTTLATNALVEGQGERVGLIAIGFDTRDLERQGLSDALKGDPMVLIEGGHGHTGNEVAALDVAALRAWLQGEGADVSGYAIAAQFSTRNPAHEVAAAEIVAQTTGHPVSASHHLSSRLNGPKRALTAVLNARLIGMINRLIGRAQDGLRNLGVTAPMMVVRGDGALISASEARRHPIETILSGPAASIVGACWLTGVQEALVSDIGGTTTDIAVLRGGRPGIDPNGAQVGSYRTMVEAVAMRTFGLGGDSEVHVESGLLARLTLGPRRVLPLSLVATQAAGIVHDALDSQLRATTPGPWDGRFVCRLPGVSAAGLPKRDADMLDRISDEVLPLKDVIRKRIEINALQRLIARGLVQLAGVTPSDAAHVLGLVEAWDRTAAEKAMRLFARQSTGSGERVARGAPELASMIISQLTHQTGLALLETAFGEDDDPFDTPPQELAEHVLMQRGLGKGKRGLIRLSTGLGVDVIGLGAPASTYYPAVGELMGSAMILPRHAGVANAVGAVVGRVTARKSGTVTSPSEGVYRVHLIDGIRDSRDLDEALNTLEAELTKQARLGAETSGAQNIHIAVARDIREAEVEGKPVFIEALIMVEASGRPRITA